MEQIRYIVRVKDPEMRRAEIAQRQAESVAKHQQRKEYKFRAGGTDLPVIRMPIDDLIYRLENYRTRDAQLSAIAAGSAPEGFFDPSRREDDSVQIRQHELLVAQARRGSGESIKPIFEELERTAEQTEDLIISADGVVVNGNRRLSAMRELHAMSAKSYHRFADVLCAVLPASATSEEILRLEIGLQMQPETKLPYEWTALGRAVRDLRDAGMTDEAIGQLMNRDKADVAKMAKMIESADLYLDTWLGRANNYQLLDDTEQAFKQIATRNLSRTDDLVLREATRKFDFLVIEQREALDDRAYAVINAIEGNPTLFLDSLAAELNVDLATPPPPVPQKKISFDSPKATPGATKKNYAPLFALLDEARATDAGARALVKKVEFVSANVAEQGRYRELAALKFAKKAEKELLAIDVQTASPGSYEDLIGCLRRCAALCVQVEAEISERTVTKGQ
ncbi:hypothetical protein [Rhodanobacter umsongensis]